MTFSEWTRRNKQNETAAKPTQTTAPASSTPDTAQTTGASVPTFAEWTAQRRKERASGSAPILYQQSGTERLSQEYLNRQSERAKPAALPELTTPGTSYAEDRTLRQNNVLRRPVGQSADAETLTEMTKLKTLERAAKDEGRSNLRNHTHKSKANEALVEQQNKIARHGLEGGAQSAKNGQAVSKVGQNRRDNLIDNLRLLDKMMKGEEIDSGISAEKKKAAVQSGGNPATGQNYYVSGVDVRDLTDDEAATYNYWFQRDKKRADEYLKAIRTDVNRRTYERENETIKQASKEHPVAAGIAGNLLSGYAAPAAAAAGLGAKITGQPYNPYSRWNTGVNIGDATAAGLTEDIKNPVGKFLASTGLSTAQFLAKLPLGSASLAFTALGSGGQTMNEAKQKGATTDQAIQLGVIAGAAEAAFEKIPLDNVLAAFRGNAGKTAGDMATRAALKNFLKKDIGDILSSVAGSAFEEGTEEFLTEIVNNIADYAIMGDKSEYEQYKKQLMDAGYDETTAGQKALAQYAYINPLVSFAGGALSGGVMAGAGALTNNAGNIIDAAKQKRIDSKIDSDYKNVPTDVTIDLTKPKTENKYSIMYDKENTPYVSIDEDVLRNVPREKWVSEIKKKIPTISSVTVGNSDIKVNAKTRNELLGSKYSRWLSATDQSKYHDKLSSLYQIDEIIRATRNYVNEAPKHKRKDDFKDFARGTVNIKAGDNEYKAEVVCGNTGRNIVLYDIINLEPISINKKTADTNSSMSRHGQITDTAVSQTQSGGTPGSPGLPISRGIPASVSTVSMPDGQARQPAGTDTTAYHGAEVSGNGQNELSQSRQATAPDNTTSVNTAPTRQGQLTDIAAVSDVGKQRTGLAESSRTPQKATSDSTISIPQTETNVNTQNLKTDANGYREVDVSDLLSDPDIIEAINNMPNLVNTASETAQKKPIRNIGDVKLDETYVSGIKHKATAEEIDLAQLIGKTFGRKVEFSDEGGINGRFDGDTIFINTKASDTMPTVLSHELLHSIEGYEGYNNVIDSLKQVAAARGQDWDSMTADIFDKYNAKYQGEGRQLTDADCDAEAAANMISSILGDEKTLTDFVRQNRSAAARMWTHLRRAVTRLGENIRNAASYMFMPAGADGERDLRRQSRMQAQALKRVTEDACDKLAKALRATKGATVQGDRQTKYSLATDNDFLDFIHECKKNPNGKLKRYNISDVSERQAKDLKALTGTDFGDYRNSITSEYITHIDNRHGEHGEHDHTMADERDVARIGYVLKNYDSVGYVYDDDGTIATSSHFNGKENRPSKLVEYRMNVGDTMVVVQAVADNSYKKLWVTSAYKTKKDGVTQATHAPQKADAFAMTPEAQLASPPSEKDGITQVSNAPHKASTPDYTSETSLPSLPSDNSISQSDGNVKRNGENNSKYSINDTSDDTTRPKNADEAKNRKKAIEMFNLGATADTVYRDTGWHYNEYGKLVVDRDAEVYTGKKKDTSKQDEAKLRERIAELQQENDLMTDIMISRKLTSDEAEQIRKQTREEVMRDLSPDSKRSPDYVPSKKQAAQIVDSITTDNHTKTQKNAFVKELLSLYDRASETDSNGVRAMSDAEIADAFDKLASKIQDSDIATDKASTEQAAELKKELHTPVFLSEKARGDISEGYGKFRKQYYGKLNLVSKEKGTPVDVRYEELSSAYPGWFPAYIETESDQLLKMAEVYDTIADPDYGRHSVYDFTDWKEAYKNDHAKIVGQLAEGFRHMETTPKTAVDRVLAANEQKQRLTEEAHQKLMDDTIAELTQDFQDEMRASREYYENLEKERSEREAEAMNREQERLEHEAEIKAQRELRRHRRGGDIDEKAVAEAYGNGKYTEKMTRLYERQLELSREFEIFSGEDISKIEDTEIKAYAKDLKERLDDMNAYVYRVERVVKNLRRDSILAKMAKGNIYNWTDKKSGDAYSLETMTRNIRDISHGDKLGETLIKDYIEPVSVDVARGNRMKQEYRDRIRELNIAQKAKAGDRLSESQFIQLYGEAVSNIEMLESERGALLKNSNGELMRAGRTLDEWKGVLDTLAKENPGIVKDIDKVKNAVKVFHECYDELLPQINKSRVLAGYAPIEYHAGYFPHFSGDQGDSVLTQMLQALGVKPGDVGGLPTSINGKTGTRRPGIRYMSNAKSRNLEGDGGQFSGTRLEKGMGAVEGFEKYLSTAADVITLTNDIQNLRSFSDALRYSGSSDGVKKQDKAIRDSTEIPESYKETVLEALYNKDNPYRLRNFVVELEEYTNLLAGKRSLYDRVWEQRLGRGFYNSIKWLESRVGANMVGGNLGSALTNFSPLVQSGAVIDQRTMISAALDTLKASRNDDGLRSRSDFLTNRFADDTLIDQTVMQKIGSEIGKPMEWIDGVTAETIVRARYAQNLKKGLADADALHEADTFAAGLMADRSKGAMPTAFERRNPVAKLFTQFQLEVNNQVGWMLKDLPREAGKKAFGKLAGMLFKYSVGAWIYNRLYEALTGRDCMFDPFDIVFGDLAGDITGRGLPTTESLIKAIKSVPNAVLGREKISEVLKNMVTREKKGVGDTVKDFAGNVLENMPFTSVLGLFSDDFDQGRIPAASALPNLTNIGNAIFNSDYSAEKRLQIAIDEGKKPFYYLALPFGGGQIRKAVEGSAYIARGGSYKPDNDGNPQLQYPLYNDNTAKTILESGKALVFGKNSTEGGKEWTENGFKRESAKATAAYKAFENGGMTRREALSAVHEIKNATKRADKVRALRNVDAESSAKIEAFRTLITDEQDDRIEYIKRAKIDFDDYLKIYDSYLNNNGLGKKTTVVADIQKLNLTKEQKDTLFLCFYKETTLKDTPWHTFGITIPMAPEFEMPELPKIDLP